MNERRWSRFEAWLDTVRGLDERTIASRISNCKRVEKFEGNLDSLFDTDELADLLERLTYSTEDVRIRRPPKHKVPIDGDVRTGTATLKTAATLYRAFRNASELDVPVRPMTRSVREQVARPRARSGSWPDWQQPSEETLRSLAQVLAPHVRFLQPEIIAALVEDTQRHAKEWSAQLRERGIDPAIYLWDGSPCAFPGVRRHAGSKEISAFRRQSDQDVLPPHCLAIDDNDFPKQVWAFTFTGKPFRKRGPVGYQLGHLVDHKEHGNRWREELDFVGGCPEPPLLFGLFTSAANAAYFPSASLRPTDFSFHLRSLVQPRAQQLYGEVCQLLPPGLEVKPCHDPEWDLEGFHWNPTVGQTTNVAAFLDYRHRRTDELLRSRGTETRIASGAFGAESPTSASLRHPDRVATQ